MRNTTLFIAALVLAFSGQAYAAKVKVIKVSGNKAVIQVPSGMEVEKGQTLNVGDEGDDFGGESSSSGGGSRGRGQRKYSIAGTLDYSSMSAKIKDADGNEGDGNKVSTLELDVKLGFNFSSFEVGPKLIYESETTTPPAGGTVTENTTTGFGAFGEYNFTENKGGVGFVPAAFGEFAFGSINSKTGSSETKTSVTQFDFGVVGKIFALSDTTAIRIALGYRMQSGKVTVGSTEYQLTNSGMVLGVGLQQYF